MDNEDSDVEMDQENEEDEDVEDDKEYEEEGVAGEEEAEIATRFASVPPWQAHAWTVTWRCGPRIGPCSAR